MDYSESDSVVPLDHPKHSEYSGLWQSVNPFDSIEMQKLKINSHSTSASFALALDLVYWQIGHYPAAVIAETQTLVQRAPENVIAD